MCYTLTLTDEEMDSVAHVGGRYDWSRAILFHLEVGENEIPESTAWDLAEAFEADTEGGHSPFPMLWPDCKLYRKLSDFWEGIV